MSSLAVKIALVSANVTFANLALALIVCEQCRVLADSAAHCLIHHQLVV